ncbi:MAG: hypothetical protein Q9192_002301 [Flavoplaca navasiana]
MNLGEANLRTVNASRPALVHSASKQSVTASDDFYSVPSANSSQDEKTAMLRYQTPPLHIIPEPYRKTPEPDSTRPTVRAVTHTHVKLPTVTPTANLGASSLIHTIKRKPLSTGSTPPSESPSTKDPTTPSFKETISASTREPISPTTPDVDDTPYIQFAIDQLTRDEEVNHAIDSRILQRTASRESYSVERVVPDERLRLQQGFQSEDRRQRPLQPTRQPSNSSVVAVPATPIQDSFRFPTLNYLPKVLRLPSMLALLICCLLMIIAIVFSNVWSSQHQGLWQYDHVGTIRYFIFQYLPQLLAIVIIFWLFVVQNALHRIIPFLMMHSEERTFTSHILQSAALFPSDYMIPDLWCFRHGEVTFGLCLNVFRLCTFIVPLHSCLYQTQYFTMDGESIWRWTAVEPIGWTLLALYILLFLALVLLMLKLRREPSGLRWDPRSLADILSLFQRSNILSDFYGSETRENMDLASPKKYTLRYWIPGKRSSEIFHGVEESQTTLRGFRHNRESKEKSAHSPLDLESQRPLKTSTLDSLQKDVHNPRIRYRWLPWFLRDTFVVAWIVIAIVLMLAFVIVSFVNNATRRGFEPKLTSMKTSQGFSPADFLYSFVPSVVGMILFLVWQPIDMYFRALQPFANLGHTQGSAADDSLLLDYTACLPLEVTIKAALAGHYKLAWISFIGLLSAAIPILSGGVFTAQYFIPTQEVRVAADMSGYYALVVFVCVYSLSFLIIWPRQKRRLPHDLRTLGQILSFVYESRLLNDAVFWQPRSRIDLVTRLLGTLTGDRGSSRYAFGVYMGRDGREHLGIDRLHRPESGEMFIATGTMR